MDSAGELVNLNLAAVELRPVLKQGMMSNRIDLDLPPPLPTEPPPPLQLYPCIARRRHIADPPTIVTGVEEQWNATSATREASWENRRQKDSSYKPPQRVPPPDSQLDLKTAS